MFAISLLAVRFVVTYLCPVRSRRRDCSRKLKRWLICGFNFFFNLGKQEVTVLLQNSEQSACDDISYFWTSRKLVEEEIKAVELMRSRPAQFIYDRNYDRTGLQPRATSSPGLLREMPWGLG